MEWRQIVKKAMTHKNSFENLDIVNALVKYWFDPYANQRLNKALARLITRKERSYFVLGKSKGMSYFYETISGSV